MLPLPDALPFEVVRFFEHNTIPSWTVGLTHGQTVTVDPAALGSGGDPIAVMTREVLVIAAARAAEDGRVELRPKRVLAGVVPEL
jgi:hypothetical protein